MANFAAVIDANCLHGLHVRNTILQLATSGLFKPRWSKEILDELAASLKVKAQVSDQQLETLVYNFSEWFPESLVEGFEHLVGKLGCSDPKDEHVLAAAITSRAGAIVTFNTKDFPSNTFDTFGIQVIHPDDFFLDLVGISKEVVVTTLGSQLESYSRPEADAEVFSAWMHRAGCPEFGQFVLENAGSINAAIHIQRIANLGVYGD